MLEHKKASQQTDRPDQLQEKGAFQYEAQQVCIPVTTYQSHACRVTLAWPITHCSENRHNSSLLQGNLHQSSKMENGSAVVVIPLDYDRNGFECSYHIYE